MDRAEELALPGMFGTRKVFPLRLQLVGGAERTHNNWGDLWEKYTEWAGAGIRKEWLSSAISILSSTASTRWLGGVRYDVSCSNGDWVWSTRCTSIREEWMRGGTQYRCMPDNLLLLLAEQLLFNRNRRWATRDWRDFSWIGGGNYKMQISSTATIRHTAEECREQSS